MKRFVVRQAGLAETEFIREFALEVPDDWTGKDVESLTLDDVNADDRIKWELDDQSKIEVNGQQVSSYDPSSTHCWHLPVARLYSEVNLDYYIRKAEAKRREAQSVTTDAGSSA